MLVPVPDQHGSVSVDVTHIWLVPVGSQAGKCRACYDCRMTVGFPVLVTSQLLSAGLLWSPPKGRTCKLNDKNNGNAQQNSRPRCQVIGNKAVCARAQACASVADCLAWYG